MSQYTSTSATIQPQISQHELCADAFRNAFSSPESWVGSAQLEAAKAELANVTSSGTGRSIKLDPLVWSAITTAAAELGIASTAKSTIAGLDLAIARARSDERTIVANVTAASLASLGYHVERHDGTSVTGLIARRNHEIVAMAVQSSGRTEFDFAGVTGSTCDERLEEIVDQVAHGGVSLDVTRTERHDDWRGGSLLAAAASARPDRLEHGIVEVGEVTERNEIDTSRRSQAEQVQNRG